MPPRSRNSQATNKLIYKQASDLMDLFEMLYRKKYNRDPVFNRIQSKYDMAELIGIMNFNQVQELIEFYFDIDVDSASMRNFLYSYEDLQEMIKDRTKDIEDRRRLMAETKARVEEYKAREQRGKTT